MNFSEERWTLRISGARFLYVLSTAAPEPMQGFVALSTIHEWHRSNAPSTESAEYHSQHHFRRIAQRWPPPQRLLVLLLRMIPPTIER